MSADRALRHPLFDGAGVEHGFGLRGSPAPPGLRRPKQIHGVAAVTATGWAQGAMPEADAIVSCEPGVPIGILTADCVPILLAEARGRAVAAIHAGWRGLAAGVIESGFHAATQLLTEATAATDWIAVVGPHIGPCCYEVDEPVWSALEGKFGTGLAEALRPTRPGHGQLDLGRLAHDALRSLGLAAEAIGRFEDLCTACDPIRFHSFRRDGVRSGRLVHHIRVGSRPPARRPPSRVDTS